MKKKLYERPAMQVVQLKQQAYLLQTSVDVQGQPGLQNYNWQTETEE